MKKSIIAGLLLFFALFMGQATANEHAAVPSHVSVTAQHSEETQMHDKGIWELLKSFYKTTGIYAFTTPQDDVVNGEGEPVSSFHQTWGRIIMIGITLLLFYLAIAKGFEPLLLIPIGFGGLLANIPMANMTGDHGFLGVIYNAGIANEFFPLLIFMGVGAMTDFGPMLANPKTALLGVRHSLVSLEPLWVRRH